MKSGYDFIDGMMKGMCFFWVEYDKLKIVEGVKTVLEVQKNQNL